MIVTRLWLNEFIDIQKVTTQHIVDVFNKRGLEVASVSSLSIPQGVVVGYVKERVQHPNADKLSVCQVDVGEKTLQIVCGAKNVDVGQWVAVAVEGVTLPNGLVIKPTTLRDVESFGMLCSTTELGLPALNDGIWVLDRSLGELKAGAYVADLPLLKDDVIEVELTANRGDCLSIRGIARELGASLGLSLKEAPVYVESEEMKAIGRVFQLHTDSTIQTSLGYKVIQSLPTSVPALVTLRLGLTIGLQKSVIDTYVQYATHATGVILRAYDGKKFHSQEDEKLHLHVKLDKGIECVGTSHNVTLDQGSIVGIFHHDELKATDEAEDVILEASYSPPSRVALAVYDLNLKTDGAFYKTSRGSEPDLEVGIGYLVSMLMKQEGYKAYIGSYIRDVPVEPLSMKLNLQTVSEIAGVEFEKNQIVQILDPLGFGVGVAYDGLVVNVPVFRHDIKNIFDMTEEIVRMVGIDNIPSKPLSFVEANRSNQTSQSIYHHRGLRKRATLAGFFETVHFIFDDKKVVEKWGMSCVDEKKDLINPITSELDTLRVSLLPHLVASAQRNVNNSFKKIPLFEVGVIYNKDREESRSMAFVWSGATQDEHITNQGKPPVITFETMAQKVSMIFGMVDFEPIENDVPLYLHPYRSAHIVLNGEIIGVMGQLDSDFQEGYDLPVTFVCEVDLEKVTTPEIQAKSASKFQGTVRDLTFIVSDERSYGEMRKVVESLTLPLLEKFAVIDNYKGSKEATTRSLTFRFWLRWDEGTLTDERVNPVMEEISQALIDQCQVSRQ